MFKTKFWQSLYTMGSNNTRESAPTITPNGTPRGNTPHESTSQEMTPQESICRDIKSSYNSYIDVRDDKVLGETFHEASQALPLLLPALQKPFRGHESWTDALSRTASVTKTVYDTITKAPDAKRLDTYKMAVRQVSDGKTVEVLVIGMMEHIYDAAKNDPSMKDQIRQLRDAMDKLSQMESSIPKESHRFVARDNAHQFNALGGDQNNNLGPGHQFIRNHVNGGINFGSRQ
ncbi:hypothetical protein F4679DRAFT_539971 [Xylaria curta]|nr:hypothetical protein F4679DRAFT_539971 [Xylaria curta]